MKKLILLVLVASLMVPSAALAFVTSVTGIKAAQAVASSTNTYIPAALRAVDVATGVQGARWVALTASRVNMANIAATVLFVGAAYGISYLGDKFQAYLAERNRMYRDGVVKESFQESVAPGDLVMQPNCTFIGFYSTMNEAYSACDAIATAQQKSWSACSSAGPTAYPGCCISWYVPSGPGGIFYGGETQTQTVWRPVAVETLRDDLGTDISTDTPNPMGVIFQALAEIEKAFLSTNAALAKKPVEWEYIKEKLNQLITPELAALVGAEVNPDINEGVNETVGTGSGMTAAELKNAVQEALIAQELSGDEIETAVKNAINDDSGVTEPVDPEITVPEKKSLTSVMQTFMEALNTLPVVNTLRGVNINVSGGSSQMCISVGSTLGGQKCWDASPLQGTLNTIGAGFLSIVTVMSVIGVFRG